MTDGQLLLVGVLWLVGCGLSASAFSNSGKSGTAGFFVALFASPLLALLYCAAASEATESESMLRSCVRQLIEAKGHQEALVEWSERLSRRDALIFAAGLPDRRLTTIEDASKVVLRDSENARKLAQAEGRLCWKCGLVRNAGMKMCPVCLV